MKKLYFGFLKTSLIFVIVLIFTLFGICKAFEGIKMIGSGENISAVDMLHGADNNIQGIRILDFNIKF